MARKKGVTYEAETTIDARYVILLRNVVEQCKAGGNPDSLDALVEKSGGLDRPTVYAALVAWDSLGMFPRTCTQCRAPVSHEARGRFARKSCDEHKSWTSTKKPRDRPPASAREQIRQVADKWLARMVAPCKRCGSTEPSGGADGYCSACVQIVREAEKRGWPPPPPPEPTYADAIAEEREDFAAPSAGLVYAGQHIRDEGERLNLTDMWKAAGRKGPEPADWLRQAGTIKFLDHLSAEIGGQDPKLVNDQDGLVQTIKGGNDPAARGTMAHWKVGLAYATDLSPAFRSWCLDVVRKYMDGKLRPKAAEGALATAIDSLAKMIAANTGTQALIVRRLEVLEMARPVAVDLEPGESAMVGSLRVTELLSMDGWNYQEGVARKLGMPEKGAGTNGVGSIAQILGIYDDPAYMRLGIYQGNVQGGSPKIHRHYNDAAVEYIRPYSVVWLRAFNKSEDRGRVGRALDAVRTVIEKEKAKS